MLNEFYADEDGVTSEEIVRDCNFIKMILPSALIKVIISSSGNSHIIVSNVRIEFDKAIKILEGTHCDKSYINLVKMKGHFFIRVTRKMEAMI